jgi:CheY-like chemotaxis protein
MQSDKMPAIEDPKWRILVVDDEPSVCETIEMILKFDGHKVQTVASGKEALSLLEQSGFDVVVTDYSMPEMKGNVLAAAIKQRSPGLPVVMITAHEAMLKSSGDPNSGVDSMVSKPFTLDELREAVAKAMRR